MKPDLDAVERVARTLYELGYPAYSETAHDDHNRWSWHGDGPNDGVKDTCRIEATAILDALPTLLWEDSPAGEDLRSRLGLRMEAIEDRPWYSTEAVIVDRRLTSEWRTINA